MTDPHDWTHPAPPAPYDSLELTRDIIRDTRGVYALRVKGTSMLDALINDGDIVILRQVHTAENGDMVAVYIRSLGCTTLKRWFAEYEENGKDWGMPPTRIRLQPENKTMDAEYYAPSDVQIQGKVIAVIRHV